MKVPARGNHAPALGPQERGALHHVRIDVIEIEPAATGKFHESASLRAECGLVAEIRDELASPQRPSGSRSAVDRHGSWVSATISTPLSTAAAMQYTVTARIRTNIQCRGIPSLYRSAGAAAV